MNGRQENDLKIEKKTLEILKGTYSILTDYFYSLIDKTPATKIKYIQRNKIFLDFIQYDNNPDKFKELKVSDINRYMEHTRYGSKGEKTVSARAGILFAVRNFFDFLETEGYIDNNICKKVKPPKITEEKDIVYMTKEEILEVENNIKKWSNIKWKNRDMLLFILGCTTGLRVSSIQEINISDIDLEENKITVTEKGNKTRSCFIGEKTKEYLVKWLKDRKSILLNRDENALFISTRKQRISTNGIRKLISLYTSTLDKKITPDKMRSTCATTLYEATGDINMVKDMLGHKNIANTMKYASMSDQKRIEATNIMNQIIG